MLITRLLPRYDFRERHEIKVEARIDYTYDAIMRADFLSDPVIRVLLSIRALPARFLDKASRPPRAASLTLRDAEQFGFSIVAENPPVEIVIALQGKFWKVNGDLECTTREGLNLPLAPGTARAVWNFHVRPTGLTSCILTTETRILCADRGARVRFGLYWLIVRPGSGIIRRMMLRRIRSVAENTSAK